MIDETVVADIPIDEEEVITEAGAWRVRVHEAGLERNTSHRILRIELTGDPTYWRSLRIPGEMFLEHPRGDATSTWVLERLALDLAQPDTPRDIELQILV